jgi:probable DNA repair protein
LQLNALLDQNVAVLTASRRLAHAVRAGYARYAQAQGRTVWRTPRALPWSAWLGQQRQQARAACLEDTSRLLTRAQARLLWDEIVASSPAGSALLNPSSAARLAARSWRRLHEYLIPLTQLAAFDAPEARALHGWCSEFVERCRALNVVDEAQLAEWAFETGFEPCERLALVGFDAVAPSMARLLARWRERRLIVDAQSARRRAHRLVAVAGNDASAELALAARWARAQVEAGKREVGVILGDLQTRREEVYRVFEDVFAPGMRTTGAAAGCIPVTIAAPAPLISYPLVEAALLIVELASGERPALLAGRLLRSPFLAGAEAERERRALADFQLRDKQLDRWNWFELERWAGLKNCEALELSARRLNALLRAELNAAPASVWAERFHRMLRAVGWPGERPLDSAEHQTLLKFQDALAEFGALDPVAGRMSLTEARAHLRNLLSDTPFEPETPSAAVTVIDAQSSAGMQFEALWVAGLHADRWPAPVNPDPLIPLELQRAAQMPEASAAGVRRQAEQQLERWMSAAEIVVFSWPMSENETALVGSPLLGELQMEDATLMAQDRTPTLRELIFAQRPALTSAPDERAPPLSEDQARGGARTVELQSVCPFRAQAELRLRATPLRRVSLGIEPIDRGALLHRVLFEIWGSLRSQEALRALDDSSLEERVRDCAARHAMQTLRADSRARSRLAALEIDSVVLQTMRLLRQERERPPFEVRLAESAQQYTLGGLTITLRPDRIDELADGQRLLIDYKLGDSHQRSDWLDRRPGRPRRAQLPLYALAQGERLAALAYVILAPGAVEYRGWSNGASVGGGVQPYPEGVRVDLGDPLDWEGLLHHWRFTLTRLAEQYVAGEAGVDPLHQACAACHLSTLCRIHERAVGEQSEEWAGGD